MTMHETLSFIRSLHDWIAGQVDRPGPSCWPTRDLLGSNLRANRPLYSGQVMQSFRTNIDMAKTRGWAIDGGCEPKCHARHITLTAKGLEVLRLMDESGCSRFRPRCEHRPLPVRLNLTRRVAA